MVERGQSQKSILCFDIGLSGLLACVVLSVSERTARVLWGATLVCESFTAEVLLVSRSGSSWVLLAASPSSGGRCSFWEWEKGERHRLTFYDRTNVFDVAGNNPIHLFYDRRQIKGKKKNWPSLAWESKQFSILTTEIRSSLVPRPSQQKLLV